MCGVKEECRIGRPQSWHCDETVLPLMLSWQALTGEVLLKESRSRVVTAAALKHCLFFSFVERGLKAKSILYFLLFCC